jgi:hypothetical protein
VTRRSTDAAAALRAQAACLRVQADALVTLADTIGNSTALANELLVVGADTVEQYHAGREALLNACDQGEINLVRGARRRLMVERSEIERWIKSRSVAPRVRKAPAIDLEKWDLEADIALQGTK